MTPVELSRTVLRAMRHAVDAGELRMAVPEAGSVRVERPRPGGCGDYATGVALQVARAAGRSPRDIAEVLSPRLAAEPGIAGVDITGPGFLNITLAGARAEALVREVMERGGCYGHVHPDTGRLAQIHVPREIRAVVLADSARRILRSQGTLVRVTCDDVLDPAWVDALGVRVDAYGRPPQETRPPHSDAARPDDAPGVRQAAQSADGHGQPPPQTTPTPRPIPTLRPVPAPADPDPLLLGRDAARWALLHPAAHDHPRPTAEHLVQRESNPLFRVRYAYSRSRALTRNAAGLGFAATPGDVPENPPQTALLDAIDAYPAVLASAAHHRAPDRLARHLVATADAFLACSAPQSGPQGTGTGTVTGSILPLGDEKPSATHRARLALAEAAGTVLAGGLSLLGISAPEYL
ncbi:ArgS-related anticodon-binding protein NrtL [Streptomyces sp. NPDC041068]|uniref:ArgS-related anticodon-binding protein NrtL n=1 Tax=Streptomyces sp. NPDC041068 TaxID=3155130 RepID=UPI0033FC76A6